MKILALFVTVLGSVVGYASADCTSEADQAILYAEDMTPFWQNYYTALCSSSLMRARMPPLSDSCLACYVKACQCGSKQCGPFGADPVCGLGGRECSKACVECGKDNCNDELAECTGIEKDDLPEPPGCEDSYCEKYVGTTAFCPSRLRRA
ncbi:unnamed protein product [Vitrella brassicaformis CCMP3155]|uniref:Uncharacterized protein n=2 Tax=Vitrella brassicaformis TaxID=1169539 RepID=A0A0G4EYP5_VITBC|nr:unnamed protein product [Vitrella brassicaformis CCMP3155]|eukprot:CEM04281.1 unnamed protein product [Vitrella brassicaformis CCMP3155]